MIKQFYEKNKAIVFKDEKTVLETPLFNFCITMFIVQFAVVGVVYGSFIIWEKFIYVDSLFAKIFYGLSLIGILFISKIILIMQLGVIHLIWKRLKL